jgi:hypothetical protein
MVPGRGCGLMAVDPLVDPESLTDEPRLHQHRNLLVLCGGEQCIKTSAADPPDKPLTTTSKDSSSRRTYVLCCPGAQAAT